MSIQMRGAEVAKAMKEKLIREREELNAAGSKSMPYDHSGRSERK